MDAVTATLRASTLLAMLGLITLTACPAGAAPPSVDLTGAWHGTLDAGSHQLRIVVHIETAEDGTLTATLDSPDQGAAGIPVSAVRRTDDGELHLELKALGATYAGTLDDAAQTLTGSWQQAGITLPLILVLGDGPGSTATTDHR